MSTPVSAAYRPEAPAAAPEERGAARSSLLERLAADVRAGLAPSQGQKTLPCKYLYDAVGSRLFEAITLLPEYGLAAADTRLLRTHAAAMVAPFAAGVEVAELGSGSARKTRFLLEALARRGQRTRYFPIEISAPALARAEAELGDIAGVEVQPLHAEYLEGLRELARQRGGSARRAPLLVLFLGSTLGNFAPAEARAFLRGLRAHVAPGDGLLLGLDLAKPAEQLLAAYDDAAGVTAAFNLNLLARLNRELGADFNLRLWRHEVRHRRRPERIEMHLRATRRQTVRIPGAGLRVTFAAGETIWTESSHKFRPGGIEPLVSQAGFQLQRVWTDPVWAFAESLCTAA